MKRRSMQALSSIKKKVLPIFKKHAVKHAAIFGSIARGTATSKSDVDFLIEYQRRNKSLLDLVDLKFALEDALGRKVDLLTYSSIYPPLRDRILAEQIVLL